MMAGRDDPSQSKYNSFKGLASMAIFLGPLMLMFYFVHATLWGAIVGYFLLIILHWDHNLGVWERGGVLGMIDPRMPVTRQAAVDKCYWSATPEVISDEVRQERQGAVKLYTQWREPAIVVFGSARLPESCEDYRIGLRLGKAIYTNGYTIRSGGGPSLMKAPLKGYVDARQDGHEGKFPENMAQAVIIELTTEQDTCIYAEDIRECGHFATRKMSLMENVSGAIALRGGIGSIDEIFEAWRKGIPLVLLGVDHWKPFADVFINSWKEAGLTDRISDYPLITDSIEEALDYIRIKSQEKFSLQQDESSLRKIEQELRAGLIQLSGIAPAVIFAGRPEAESQELETAAKLSSLLMTKNVAVRSARSGSLLQKLFQAAKSTGQEELLQAVLQSPDAGPSLAEIANNFNGRLFATTDILNHQIMITENAFAFVFTPGSKATMNMLFDIACVMQTGKVPRRPIILIGKAFWQPIKEVLVGQLLDQNEPLMDQEDANLFFVVDTAEEALGILESQNTQQVEIPADAAFAQACGRLEDQVRGYFASKSKDELLDWDIQIDSVFFSAEQACKNYLGRLYEYLFSLLKSRTVSKLVLFKGLSESEFPSYVCMPFTKSELTKLAQITDSSELGIRVFRSATGETRLFVIRGEEDGCPRHFSGQSIYSGHTHPCVSEYSLLDTISIEDNDAAVRGKTFILGWNRDGQLQLAIYRKNSVWALFVGEQALAKLRGMGVVQADKASQPQGDQPPHGCGAMKPGEFDDGTEYDSANQANALDVIRRYFSNVQIFEAESDFRKYLYFPSNEIGPSRKYILGQRPEDVQGGAYIGTSVEQNFTFMLLHNPDVSYIIDCNRDVIEIFLPLLMALIILSPSRREFFNRLFSLEIPENYFTDSQSLWCALQFIQETGQQLDSSWLCDDDYSEEIVKRSNRSWPWGKDHSAQKSMISGICEPFWLARGVPAWAIGCVLSNYFMSTYSRGLLARRLLHTIRGYEEKGYTHWLSTEASFQALKEYILTHDIVGIAAYFQDSGFEAVRLDLEKRKEPRVNVVYLSNIYLTPYVSLSDKLRRLPWGEKALLLHGGTCHQSYYHRASAFASLLRVKGIFVDIFTRLIPQRLNRHRKDDPVIGDKPPHGCGAMKPGEFDDGSEYDDLVEIPGAQGVPPWETSPHSNSQDRSDGQGGVSSLTAMPLRKSAQANSKLREMDRMFIEQGARYEFSCYGLTERDASGQEVLVDLVLPRQGKILIGDEDMATHFCGSAFVLFTPAFLYSNELSLVLSSANEPMFVSDNPESSFVLLAECDWQQLCSIVSRIAGRELPDTISGLKEVLEKEGNIPLSLDWDIVISGGDVIVKPVFTDRAKQQAKERGLRLTYCMHYHPMPQAELQAEELLEYSPEDLSCHKNMGFVWFEIRILDREESGQEVCRGQVYNADVEIKAMEERLFAAVPYFDSPGASALYERQAQELGLWFNLAEVFSCSRLFAKFRDTIDKAAVDVAALSQEQAAAEFERDARRVFEYDGGDLPAKDKEEEWDRYITYSLKKAILFFSAFEVHAEKGYPLLRRILIILRYLASQCPVPAPRPDEADELTESVPQGQPYQEYRPVSYSSRMLLLPITGALPQGILVVLGLAAIIFGIAYLIKSRKLKSLNNIPAGLFAPVSDYLKSIQNKYHDYLVEAFFSRYPRVCHLSCEILAKVLSAKFNLPVGGNSPDRIEIIEGKLKAPFYLTGKERQLWDQYSSGHRW
ncbi:MAG: LOG family protein, partial [Candidatus Omnitrophota bacterium]